MSKIRALELLPFFALIAAMAIISSATMATAGFSVPDLFGRFSFGSAHPAYEPGITTTVQKASMPFGGLSVPSGFSMPFSGVSPFRMPVTSERSYKRTIMTPDGPKTQVVDRVFDSHTGQWTTVVTNL